jgi:hypothetical protein
LNNGIPETDITFPVPYLGKRLFENIPEALFVQIVRFTTEDPPEGGGEGRGGLR